jgi:hypothetical protein
MPIKTNITNKTPRRQLFKKEITLMSRGFSNPAAWPGGKLTVYPWDTEVDEYLIEQARKSSRQQLVYGLLNKLCDLNGGKIEEFVAEEVNTVLLVARALSTEGIVNYTSECPMCAKKRVETIKVPDELEKVGEKPTDYPGYDDITLPVSKDVVRLRPLLVKDELIIEQRDDAQRRLVSDTRLRMLMPIVSVNEGKPDTLEELVNYIRILHPNDVQYLEQQQKKLTPHLNANVPHKCDDCGKEYTHLLSFDQQFFR